MKHFFYFALFFICTSSYAQQKDVKIEVYYNYVTNFFGTGSEYRINSKLTYNTEMSIYEMDHTNSILTDSTFQAKKNNKVFGVKSKSNTFVFKNFLNNDIFATNNIGFSTFYIKGSTNGLFDWKLEKETKEILGYSCQKATCDFGGRKYEAFFTSDINVPNGPWRFHGLPGLILEVKSTDGVFSLTSTDLKISRSKVVIENPYANKKTMSWDDFLLLYRRKYDAMLRNTMTKNGPTGSLSKGGIIQYIYD